MMGRGRVYDKFKAAAESTDANGFRFAMSGDGIKFRGDGIRGDGTTRDEQGTSGDTTPLPLDSDGTASLEETQAL